MAKRLKSFNLKHPCGVFISNKLLESDLPDDIKETKNDIKTGYVWYSLSSAEIEGDLFFSRLCFYHGVIDSFEVQLSNPECEGKYFWDKWSEEREIQRAQNTKEWFLKLGYETRSYSWGGVWAVFDRKSGIGCGGVRYKQKK